MKKVIFDENLNWFTRFVFKLFKKPIISKIQLKDLINNTKNLDLLPREDKSYNEYLKEYFNAKS